MSNRFNYLQFLTENNINQTLYESGFFCGNFNDSNSSISCVLSEMGYEAENMIAGSFLRKIHPDDITTFKILLERLHNALEDSFYCEYRMLDNNEKWQWINTQAFVIKRNPDGTVNKLIGIDRNISSVKRVENYYHDELFETRKKLELFESLRKIGNAPSNLNDSLEKLRGIVNFTHCAVFLYEDGGYKPLAGYPDGPESNFDPAEIIPVPGNPDPFIIDGKPGLMPYRSAIIVPLQIGRNILGCMLLCHQDSSVYKGKDLFPLKNFSDFLAILLNNYILKKREREIREQTHREKQLQIARELHDGIAQNLASSRIITEQLADPRQRESVDESELTRLHNIIRNTLGEVRILSEGLRLSAEKRDLAELIDSYCEKLRSYLSKELSCRTDRSRSFSVGPRFSENFLRIIQEGVANAERHSSGGRIEINLRCTAACAIIVISDDGIPAYPFTEGLGLRGMRERARKLGGRLAWDERNTASTNLKISLPADIFNGENDE